jgi:hypothetical protein
MDPVDLSALAVAGQPNVAVDAGRGKFVLSWQARLGDGCVALRVAELDAAGVLGAVHEVARGCDWFVNWADFPSLVVADNGDWLIHWLRKTSADTYAYEIRTSRSVDRGLTWSKSLVPHDDGTQTEHGFVSMAPAGGARVRLVWLDGREMDPAAAAAGGHAHHAGVEGRMTVRSVVLDRKGIEAGSAAQIDGQACSCCATDLVRLPGRRGHLALFRDRTDAEIRDIRSARHDGKRWTIDAPIHPDNWKIAACPVNGPALAAGHGDALAVWATMPNSDELAVRMRRLDAAPGFQTLEQGSAVLGRVDASVFGRGWLVSWLGADAQRKGGSVLQLAHLDADLQRRDSVAVARLRSDRNIGMPRLAVLADVAVLVWTEVSEPPTQGTRAATALRAVRVRATHAPN